MTSRSRLTPGMTTIIETETIPARALFEFLDRYLDEMLKGGGGQRQSELRVLDACADLKRLLRGTPCTPLLAAMWAQEIGAPSGSGKPLGVSGLIDNYIRRILLPSASGDEELIYKLTQDIVKIAELELRDQFLPMHVSRDDTIEIMRGLDRTDFKSRLEVLERSQLLKAPSTEFNIIRIEPDPIAEHLVARSYARDFGKNTSEWRSLLARIRAKGSPRGFVSALAACAEDEVYGKDIPTLVRQQILSLRDGGESIKSVA